MFILASSSPRRKELLEKILPNFTVMVPGIEEHLVKAPKSALPQEISKMKAYALFSKHPNDIVLACDTIVYINGVTFGKPKDFEEASFMLHRLSGKMHKVISGFTLIGPNFEINKTVVTKVFFNKLSDEFINAYAATKSPMDKAGAYGIQDQNFQLVEKIEGSYDNVMGLPTEVLKKQLARLRLID